MIDPMTSPELQEWFFYQASLGEYSRPRRKTSRQKEAPATDTKILPKEAPATDTDKTDNTNSTSAPTIWGYVGAACEWIAKRFSSEKVEGEKKTDEAVLRRSSVGEKHSAGI